MSDLVVHQLPGAWGLQSISPFCLKLEAYLRMVQIPFRTVVDATPFAGPKGKAPWIEHEGKKIGDSGFIIEYLEQRFGVNPNAALSASERAISRALRCLLEENLYWTLVFDRWLVDENWQGFREVVLGKLPSPVRPLAGSMARRSVRRQIRGHGMGIHTAAEIHAIGRRDIGAVADFLDDKAFLMGATPSEIDAIAYGFLANIVNAPVTSPVKDYALSRPNLIEYLARFRARYFT